MVHWPNQRPRSHWHRRPRGYRAFRACAAPLRRGAGRRSVLSSWVPAAKGVKGTSAVLNKPVGVVFFNGFVYSCDSGNNRVRRIAASDLTITTVAGNGAADFSGDGGLAT